MVPQLKIIQSLTLIFLAANIALGCKEKMPVASSEGEYCNTNSNKVNGVSFVGSVNPIPDTAFDPVVRANANWVTLMPFAFTGNGNPNLQWGTQQWYGETPAGVADNIKQAKSRGLKIMVKPQMWLFGGTYTGDYDLSNDNDWQSFESRYQSYILEFAHISDSLGVEMFCIGTELKTFIAKRPAFWNSLIDTVKTVFDGELTYAGNWDSYKAAPFWGKLDYIGVDAYFPLDASKTPDRLKMMESWDQHARELEAQSKQYGKPILFTEYGYRSVDHAADKPWESGSGGNPNMDAQANCYFALYERMWKKDWFAGGFLWKWFDFNQSAGGLQDNRFTPQNKPALVLIREWYKIN